MDLISSLLTLYRHSHKTPYMPDEKPDNSVMFENVRRIYEQLPFNRYLGMNIVGLSPEEAGFTFDMRDELIGNFVQGTLHGGVISAVLDTTGGMTATFSLIEKLRGIPAEEMISRIARIGTIDLRVDYLRPGRGTRFFSRGTIMRAGNKVAVTRMEIKNQEQVLIAVGTGAYLIG